MKVSGVGKREGYRFLCRLGDLADRSSRGFSVVVRDEVIDLFVVRSAGRVFGYRNSCPHTGAPLEWTTDQFLDHEGSFIQCAIHGALFLIDSGYCIRGPCAGRSLEALAVKTVADDVVLDLPE